MHKTLQLCARAMLAYCTRRRSYNNDYVGDGQSAASVLKLTRRRTSHPNALGTDLTSLHGLIEYILVGSFPTKTVLVVLAFEQWMIPQAACRTSRSSLMSSPQPWLWWSWVFAHMVGSAPDYLDGMMALFWLRW
jgi:hypothetical protein